MLCSGTAVLHISNIGHTSPANKLLHTTRVDVAVFRAVLVRFARSKAAVESLGRMAAAASVTIVLPIFFSLSIANQKDNRYNNSIGVKQRMVAMDNAYFERLHRDEARRAEWRLLDQALATRSGDKYPVRVRLGHLLIWAGASLAHETVSVQSKPCQTGQC